jgi:hypothetical protein
MILSEYRQGCNDGIVRFVFRRGGLCIPIQPFSLPVHRHDDTKFEDFTHDFSSALCTNGSTLQSSCKNRRK